MPSVKAHLAPGRRIKVVLDETFGPSLEQPALRLTRNGPMIGVGQSNTGVMYVPGIGWTMRPRGWSESEVLETHAEAAVLQTGTGTVATGFLAVPINAPPSITGVTYPTISAFSEFYRKEPSGDWSTYVLATDQGSFPSPDTGTDFTSMDRVWYSASVHSPLTPVSGWIEVPGTRLNGAAALATFYHTGVASKTSTFTGSGRLCLKLFGNGQAEVWELNTAGDTYKEVRTWHWKDSHATGMYCIRIVTDAYDSGTVDDDENPIYWGTTVYYDVWQISASGGGLIQALATVAELAIVGEEEFVNRHRPNSCLYRALGGKKGAITFEKLRVDIRRDVNCHFAMGVHPYNESETLIDSPFELTCPPTDTNVHLFVNCYGRCPTGTALNVTLVDLFDESTITPTLITAFPTGSTTEYVVNANHRRYQAHITFVSDDPDRKYSPVLASVEYYRNPQKQTYSDVGVEVTEFPAGEPPEDAGWAPMTGARRVSVADFGEDPMSERASLSFSAMDGSFDWLKNRTMVNLGVYVVEADHSEWPLFLGTIPKIAYLDRVPEGWEKGRSRTDFKLDAQGLWLRAYKKLFQNYTSMWDADANDAKEVSEGVRECLRNAGEPTTGVEQIDGLRMFFPSVQEAQCNPGDRPIQRAQEIWHDHTGGYFRPDPGCGTKYLWRTVRPKRPPFTPCFAFRMAGSAKRGAGPGLWKDAMYDGLEKVDLSAIDGVTVAVTDLPVVEMIATNLNDMPANEVVPPDACFVKVVGGGVEDASGDSGALAAVDKRPPATSSRFTTLVLNPKSFNYKSLDESDDDFPDRNDPDWQGEGYGITFVSTLLRSQKAVDWTALLLFESFCFSRECKTGRCILMPVTDTTDALQVRPRKPARYDIAVELFDDDTYIPWLVESVVVDQGTIDANSTMVVSFIRSAAFETVGTVIRSETTRRDTLEQVNRGMGLAALTPQGFSGQASSVHSTGLVSTLPFAPTSTVQDFDTGLITYPDGYLT